MCSFRTSPGILQAERAPILKPQKAKKPLKDIKSLKNLKHFQGSILLPTQDLLPGAPPFEGAVARRHRRPHRVGPKVSRMAREVVNGPLRHQTILGDSIGTLFELI